MSFRYRHGDRPLDGYTIKRGVGTGGFGEVYYALSDGGREVALKSILQNRDIELRGVRHCINLKSPHLVSIFDVKTGEDGTPFVIMEYVAGPSLRDLLREHPNGLGEDKAAFLAREIARGLAYLHENGIVHRDLKPENIFYEDGYVKIGDYGLSKFISVSHQSGQTMSVGTVHYMAPEIGSGVYSRGIDIYALGVMLYELLTGKVPFQGDSFGEILMKHLTAKPDLNGLSQPFHSVIERALEKKPEDRYQRVEEMAEELFASSDLSQRVSVLQPGSLSIAARGRTGDASVSPGPASPAAPATPDPLAETGPVATRTPPPAPSPVPRPAVRPAGSPAGGSPRTKASPPPLPPRTSPPSPPPPGRSEYVNSPNGPHASSVEPGLRSSGWKTSIQVSFDDASRMDPLDKTQRLARAAISAGILAVCLGLLDRWSGVVGYFFVIASGAAAVLGTEMHLGDRLQIAAGFPRRAVAAFLGIVPMSVGALAYGRGGDDAIIFLLIGMLVIDWKERFDPNREERNSAVLAILAGCLGLLLAVFPGENHLFTGGCLAGISLLVGAYAPFIPKELRQSSSWRSNPGRPPNRPTGTPPSPQSPGPRGAGGGGRAAASQPVAATASTQEARASSEPAAAFTAAPPSSLPVGNAPGGFARFSWCFIAALAIAGGLSCLAIALSSPGNAHANEHLIGLGIGSLGVAGFGLYRGLWTRGTTFWSRTLQPFLVGGSATLGLVCASHVFLVPEIYPEFVRYDDFRSAMSVGLSVAVVATLFFAVVGRLADFGGYRPELVSQLPRAARPVHPVGRILFVLFGAVAVAIALGFVMMGTRSGEEWQISEHLSRDGLRDLSIAIIACTAGAYGLRQGLRRQIGTFWGGTLRPLVLLASGSTVGLACLHLSWAEALEMHNMHEMLIVVSIFAGVFGLFAYFFRGAATPPIPAHLSDPGSNGLPASEAPTPSPTMSFLGLIAWVFALPLGLYASAVAADVIEPLPVLDHESSALACLVCSIVGSVGIAASRLRCGGAHALRAVLAQGLFVLSMFSFGEASYSLGRVSSFAAARSSSWSSDSFNHAAIAVAGALIGCLLILWPAKAKPAPETPEPETRRTEV